MPIEKTHLKSPVVVFLIEAEQQNADLFVSVITIGELRRGVEIIRHRCDHQQVGVLETWLQTVIDDYAENMLELTEAEAQVWGCLRVPHYENALDKQITATALTHDLKG